MPLVTVAFFCAAAGLLLGFGGAVLLAVLLASGALAVSVVRRSTAAGAASGLFLAAAVLGHALRVTDAACGRAIATSGRATVRLSEDMQPGRGTRGVAFGAGCRVRVRVHARGGRGEAGALVAARGLARRDGDFVVISDASLTTLEPPGILARWRSRTGRRIDALYGAQAPLARALLIADERDIAPEVRRAFADAGIIHMLSVSGLHVAVLAEATMLALLLCGASVRRAEVVTVALTVAFVVFVGAPAPAVRAGAMYGAVLVARRLQRPTSPWAILALGAMPSLADPRVVMDVGYQLSVAGMVGLIASGALTRRLSVPAHPPWRERLARETLATVIASAVTAPIVAWHFGRVSLAAPFTNLAAAPLFGLAQPALFLSLVVTPITPLATFAADGTSVLLAAISAVARWGAAIPGAALDVTPSPTTALLAAASSVALVGACMSRRWITPVLGGATAIAAVLWLPFVARGSVDLELHLLDVGQGDAIALRTPSGRWILVDAGETWKGGDAGARVVAPYVQRRGGEVAALILTHPHSDHIGGVASLLRRLRVRAVYDGGLAYPSAVYDSVLTSTRVHGVPWRLARAGESLTIDGVRLLFLGPDSATAAHAKDANEASVVVLAEYRGARILLTGDAERDEEGRMLSEFGEQLRADVLKVGHHGSSTSSGDIFLDAVRPRLALVSVGAGNRYGHPSPEVLRAFAARGVQVLRTDEDGAVVVRTDGRSLRVRSEDASWELRIASRRR